MELRQTLAERRAINYFDPEKPVSDAELAAKDAGLDTHPMDGFDHEGVRKAFDIPDNYFVPVLIAAGHFDAKRTLMPPKWRKKYGEIVIREY
jgi:nitroreductase